MRGLLGGILELFLRLCCSTWFFDLLAFSALVLITVVTAWMFNF